MNPLKGVIEYQPLINAMKSNNGGHGFRGPSQKEKMRIKSTFKIYYVMNQEFSNMLARDVMKNIEGQNI